MQKLTRWQCLLLAVPGKVTNGAFTSRIRCHHNDYAHKRNLGTQTSPSNKTKLSLIAFLLPHSSIRLEMLLKDASVMEEGVYLNLRGVLSDVHRASGRGNNVPTSSKDTTICQ